MYRVHLVLLLKAAATDLGFKEALLETLFTLQQR